MSTAVGAVTALDPATGKTVWFDTLPPRPDGQPGARRVDAQPRLLDRRQGRAHHRQRRQQPRGAQRQDRQALRRLRRQRSGRSAERLRAPDHRLALEQRAAGRQGRRSSSAACRRRPPTSSTSARSAPKEMPPDDIRGYDVRTGKHLWTFHVVPRKGEFGNETWLNDSWTYSGNSGVWSLISGDEELGYVYLPTRERDRRLLRRHAARATTCSPRASCASTRRPASACGTSRSCITACGTTTCRPRRCSPTSPSTAGASRRSRRSSKQAFVYVLDRTNGQPVWPIEERPVPQGNVPGEWYSPTQPIPTQAARLRSAGRVREGPHRLHAGAEGRGAEDRQRVQVRPALHAARRCSADPDGPKGTIFMPGTNGGADWGGAAFDKETGILYVPVGAPARRPRARQVAAPRVHAAVRQAGRCRGSSARRACPTRSSRRTRGSSRSI